MKSKERIQPEMKIDSKIRSQTITRLSCGNLPVFANLRFQERGKHICPIFVLIQYIQVPLTVKVLFGNTQRLQIKEVAEMKVMCLGYEK